MHEMGIAQSIIDIAIQESQARSAVAVRTVGLAIGELAGVDTESLRFCFDCLKRDTPLAGAVLTIDFRKRRHRCPACRHEFDIAGYVFRCPVCGHDQTECVSGQELDINHLEMEINE